MNDAHPAAELDATDIPARPAAAVRRGPAAPLSEDSLLAVEIRGLVERGQMDCTVKDTRD